MRRLVLSAVFVVSGCGPISYCAVRCERSRAQLERDFGVKVPLESCLELDFVASNDCASCNEVFTRRFGLALSCQAP